MILGTSQRCYKFSSEDEFRILGCVDESSRENVRRCGRTNAVNKQGFLEGHQEKLKQGCPVENKMSGKNLKVGKRKQ